MKTRHDTCLQDKVPHASSIEQKEKIFPETLKNQLTISIELKDDHHWEVFQILLTIFGYTELIPNPYGTLRNTPLLKELN